MKVCYFIVVALLSFSTFAKEMSDQEKKEVHQAFKDKIQQSMSVDHTLVDKGENFAVYEKNKKEPLTPEKILNIDIGSKWKKSYEKISDFESLYHWRLNNKHEKKKVFEMVTLSVFPDMTESVDDYKKTLNAYSLLRDLGSKFKDVDQDLSAEIPYASWLLYSPKNSQNKKGEVMLYKLMKHQNTMYLMIKMWRTRSWNPKKKSRVSEKLIKPWIDVFKGQWLENKTNHSNLITVNNS